MKSRRALPVIACLLVGGCATSNDTGRTRLMAPSEVGAAYSEVEAQARLAVTPDVECPQGDCMGHEAFRLRVLQLADRLQDGAYKLALETNLAPRRFNVGVPGKDDIGTLSTGAGNIVVFDGLREFEFPDAALAFLIAREMGHVVARHHEENSATSLTVSLAVALLFPMANLLRGAEAAYAAASTASLASSAVSFAGARIVRDIYRDEQRREADLLALRILIHAGWTPFEVAHALEASAPRFSTDGWLNGLHESRLWLGQLATGPLPQEAVAAEPASVAVEATVEPLAAAPVAFVAPMALPPPESMALPSAQSAVRVAKPAARKVVRECKVRKSHGATKRICGGRPAPQRKSTSVRVGKGRR